jgi:hypothetical protein
MVLYPGGGVGMSFPRLIVGLVLLVFSLPGFARSNYPTTPDLQMTPGSYCDRPQSYRYSERVPCCERSVSSGRKRQIIEDYNKKLGYDIRSGDRQQFKIDHLIPLCAGGSNNDDNLWPQHESVYKVTDELEGLICVKMSQGKLLQRRAIELLMRAKHNLEETAEIQALVEAL